MAYFIPKHAQRMRMFLSWKVWHCWCLTLSLLVLLSGGWYWYMYQPLNGKIDRYNQQILEAHHKIIAAAHTKHHELNTTLEVGASVVEEMQSDTQPIVSLFDAISQAGLHLARCTFDKGAQEKDSATEKVDIQMQGTYNQILQFLQATPRMSAVCLHDVFTLTQVSEKNVMFTGSFFLRAIL